MSAAAPPTAGVPTPEGVLLHFRTAGASERAVAFAIDLAWLAVGGGAVTLLLLVVLRLPALAILAVFVLRMGWFAWFETRWNGRTPGKSRLHLRVIRADGGPLSAEILFARNLTREVEFFLPLTVLAQPEVLFGDHHGVVRLVASAWVLLLLFFPLTNRHRVRLGDLLAGTRVVASPPVTLLRDLADRAHPAARADAEPQRRFTAAQLDVYGVRELEVLEGVLRKAHSGADPAVAAVAKSIARRIGAGEVREPLPFLRAFYAAQRRHLEQRLLLGERREHKRPSRGTKG